MHLYAGFNTSDLRKHRSAYAAYGSPREADLHPSRVRARDAPYAAYAVPYIPVWVRLIAEYA